MRELSNLVAMLSQTPCMRSSFAAHKQKACSEEEAAAEERSSERRLSRLELAALPASQKAHT